MWLSDSKLRLTSDNRKTLIGRSPVRVYEAGGSFPNTKADAQKVTPAHTHRPTLGAGTNKHDYNVSKNCAENWLYFTIQLAHVWQIKNCTKWYYAPKCTAEKPYVLWQQILECTEEYRRTAGSKNLIL